MDTPKLKNIIIIILLLLNGFLLAIMISDSVETAREHRLAEQQLRQVLSSQGIELSEDVDLGLTAPASRTVIRDMDKELRLMEKVIGADRAENQGGNIYYYEGKNGQAVIRSTGEADILFTGEGGRVGDDIASGTKKLFKKGDLILEVEDKEDDTSCYFICLWDGYPVYNARLEASHYGDSIQLVTGSVAYGTESGKEAQPGFDCVTALMRFLQAAREGGYIFSRIENVSVGYIMSVTMPGEYSLKGVWRIEMDTGTVFTNGETGRIENIP